MNIYMSVALLYLLLIDKFENAYLFSICFIITMLLSDLIIGLIKKIITPKMETLVSILVSGIVVSVIEYLLHLYIPGFYKDMGVYLPLMMLIKYDFRSNRKISESVIYTLKGAIKYVLLLLIAVLIKEILFTNTITLMNNISSITGYRAIYNIFKPNNIIPIPSTLNFLLIGIILGISNKVRGDRNA